MVSAIRSLYNVIGTIIQKSLDLPVIDDKERNELTTLVSKFFTESPRIDMIKHCWGRFEELPQRDNERKVILKTLVDHSVWVVESFKSPTNTSPPEWTFSIIAEFNDKFRDAKTPDKKDEVRKMCMNNINMLKDKQFPQIDEPFGRLEQIILNENKQFRKYFDDLKRRLNSIGAQEFAKLII